MIQSLVIVELLYKKEDTHLLAGLPLPPEKFKVTHSPVESAVFLPTIHEKNVFYELN